MSKNEVQYRYTDTRGRVFMGNHAEMYYRYRNARQKGKLEKIEDKSRGGKETGNEEGCINTEVRLSSK